MNSWLSSHYTDTGKIRSVNEDSLLASNQHSLWAVADGMGGHENGDYASQYVTKELEKYRNSETLGVAIARINRCLSNCNTHLVDKASAEQRNVIGCTVAVLYIHDRQATCIWSGDSRIYRLRNARLRLLTRDHNFESLTDDRDVIAHPKAMTGDEQMLTNAIGGDRQLQIEHCRYTVKEDDQFLVCTDGLYKEVSDHEILETLYHTQRGEESVQALATIYQDRGARDNVGMVHIFQESH